VAIMAEQEIEISWSELEHFRGEGFRRFGWIHDIPIVDLRTELRRMSSDATELLDVGAGAHKPLIRMLEGIDVRYRSVDTDPVGDFDFHDVSEIPADLNFDLAVANQILEHVSPDAALEIVRGVTNVLRPDGRFAATVPNTSHPVRQWTATHVTAWAVLDLYGLFRLAGLEVDQLARYTKRRLTYRPIRRMIVKTVAREFRVDWCDSILIVGRRPAGE
jgi:2-polyprenyl-3-methyl-5-hydroxy-6-metoxy-1,4-benzoquinol methylase